ncbi:MAG: caspase domain-containing protein [Hyphomicrobium sp.]
MRNPGIRTAALAWATAILTLSVPTAWGADNRVALVIGNSAYANANKLANPANDAADMGAHLKKLGFKVFLGLDLDKTGFDAKIRDFAAVLEESGTAILFYAGHGLQVGGQNYLVPVDAKLARERDLEFEAIKLDFILKQMELGRENKTNIVFLDACRDNPLSRSLARNMGTRSTAVGQGLAQVDAGVGTFVAYSTQPGNVALDGDGRNSPFTAALAKRMLESGRNLTSVMIDVRKDVIAATSGKQVPWDHSALTGEFYFDPKAAPLGGDDASQARVKELEDQLKSKARSADVASTAALTQLRQRVRQMDDETRRDRERMFAIQREQMDVHDALKLGSMSQEIGRIQMGMVSRGRDQQELRTQIEKLEKELGITAGDEAGGEKQ